MMYGQKNIKSVRKPQNPHDMLIFVENLKE